MLRFMVQAVLVATVVGACGTSAPSATPTATSTGEPSAIAPSTAASTTAQPSQEGYAGTSWQATAASLAESVGERFTFQCPPGGVNWFIYGTDVYTSDSSVCTAAVHLGLMTLQSGGVVTIEMRPGQDSYVGSDRNGIHSAGYGPWPGSYVFVSPQGDVLAPTMRATPAATAAATASEVVPTPPATTPAATSAINDELLQAGQLTICMPFERTRFAERDSSGRPFGVDVEIGNALAQELALQPVIVEVAFEGLIGAILNGQCDVTIGGQFITAARLELIDMVPYRQGTQHVVVRAGNPLGITVMADLCGRTVAIVEGTIHVDILRDVGDDCAAAGRQRVQAAQFPSETDAEAGLSSGAADAYIGNDFIAVERPDEFELSVALPPLRNGIGHRLGASLLDAALRSGLRTLIGDGRYDEILERYGVTQVRLTELP